MADLSIKLKTQADSSSFNASIKELESKVPPINIKARIEGVTGLTGLSGKSALESADFLKNLGPLTQKIESVKTELNEMAVEGTLSAEMFSKLKAQVSKVEAQMQKGTISFNEGAQALDRISEKANGSGKSFKFFASNLKHSITAISSWAVATTIVYGTIHAIEQMVDAVIELDSALVELSKVFDATDEQINKVKDSAFELASQLGSTGLDVINATTEFKRMGYTIDESLDLAQTAIMLTNVAEGLDDAGEAASIITSILKGLGVNAEYAESILDRLNEVSNNNAVSLATLADMAQRAAATMNILGNTFDQTLGLLTGAYEVLQDERVAKGIQTVGLRIAGLNEDLTAQIGLSNQVVEGLQKYAGINAFDEQTGQIKSTYAILDELADKWDLLNTNQQITLQNLLGGKERADVVAALMANWEGVSDAIKDAENSAGSARKEQEAFLKSIMASINEVKNAFMDVAQELIPRELIKSVVDLLKSVLVLLKPIATIIGRILQILQVDYALELWGYILEFIGEALSTIISFLEPIADLIESIFELVASAAEWIKPVFEWLLTALGKLADAVHLFLDPIKDVANWIGNAANDVVNFFKRLVGAADDTHKDLAETFNQEEVNKYKKALGELTNAMGDQKIAAQEYLETLQKQNEEREKEKTLNEKLLAVEKARQALAEAKTKKIRVFRAGVGFTYESDAASVQTAQESLNEAIDALSEYKYEQALNRAQEFVNEFQGILSGDNVIEGWEELFNNFSDLLDTEFADYLKKSQEFVDDFNEEWGDLHAQIIETEKNKNATNETSEDSNIHVETKGSKWSGSGGRAWAKGTTNAPAGLSLVGENGPELRVLNQGDGIIPADLTRNLMSLARNPKIASNASTGQTLVFNGPLNFPNVRNADDAKGFVEGIMTIGASKIPKYN